MDNAKFYQIISIVEKKNRLTLILIFSIIISYIIELVLLFKIRWMLGEDTYFIYRLCIIVLSGMLFLIPYLRMKYISKKNDFYCKKCKKVFFVKDINFLEENKKCPHCSFPLFE